MSETLALVDRRDMYLNRGNLNCLECIENADACMRIGRWIDNDAIIDSKGLLDGVDQVSLMIGLLDVDGIKAFFFSCGST